MISLDQHLVNIDDSDSRQEAIEYKAQEISKQIRSQLLVKLSGDKYLYGVEDFMSDNEIACEDSGEFCAILTKDADSYEEGLHDKFELWCNELATKSIDNRWSK
jgi:hypothetical protein